MDSMSRCSVSKHGEKKADASLRSGRHAFCHPEGAQRPKDLLLPLLLVACLAIPALAQKESKSDKAAEQALYRLEDDFTRAVVKRDSAALSKLVAPTWVYSDESGVMTRDDGIKAFTSGPEVVRSASNADMRAMIYGNAAVVIGILKMSGTSPKGPFSRRYRYTDTWVLADGRWRCVASQDYLMPDTKR